MMMFVLSMMMTMMMLKIELVDVNDVIGVVVPL